MSSNSLLAISGSDPFPSTDEAKDIALGLRRQVYVADDTIAAIVGRSPMELEKWKAEDPVYALRYNRAKAIQLADLADIVSKGNPAMMTSLYEELRGQAGADAVPELTLRVVRPNGTD